MKVLYVDCETTGIDRSSCRIYQISGIVEIDNAIVEHFNFMMNPGDVTIDDWVIDNIESQGLSIEMLLEYKNSDEVFSEFTALLDRYIDRFDKSDKFHICGYNVRFDDDFMRIWFADNGHKFYDAYFYTDLLDVMTLASFILAPIRHKLTNFRLLTICKLFDIPIIAHDAKSDIEATYNLKKSLENYCQFKKIN